MVSKNLDGKLPQQSDNYQISPEFGLRCEQLQNLIRQTVSEDLPRNFTTLNFSLGIEAWMGCVYSCNQYVDEQAPWALRKSDPERMMAVLATLFVCIRDLAIAIQSIIPASAEALLDQMGIPIEQRNYAALLDSTWYERLTTSGFRLKPPTPIFPRLELPTEAAV